MSASRPVYIFDVEPDGRYVLLRGNAPEVLHRYGIPVLWSATYGGWWLRRERLADFRAQADECRVPVREEGTP